MTFKNRPAFVLALCGFMSQQLLLADEQSVDIDALLAAGSQAFNSGDVIAAMNHYRSAADAGSLDAKVRLAWILDQSEDNEGAVVLYQEAAAAGLVEGQFGLAEMYAKGEGVEQDFTSAVRYFTAAAENGHQDSMRILANAYAEGALGLPADAGKAAIWQERIAAASDLQDASGKKRNQD